LSVLLVGSDAPNNRDDGDSRELAAFVAETLGSTVDTHLIHRYGQPTEAILRTSTAAGADLIVMGSHGRTGVQRLLFGSVTEAVVRRSATPVLVAPRASAGLQHPVTLDVVLCAVDFSPSSQRALAYAASVAYGAGPIWCLLTFSSGRKSPTCFPQLKVAVFRRPRMMR